MTTPTPQTVSLDLDKIDLPADAREHDPEKLEIIVKDMDKEGQLQEIIVTAAADGRYEVLAGAGRVRSARKLNWPKIRASVREGVSEFEKARITFAENEVRDDADPFYQAAQIQKMLKARKIEQQALATELGMSDSTISDYMIIDKMAPSVKAHSRRLELTHLLQIARLNDAEMQIRLAKKCHENGISSRQLRALVDHKLAKGSAAKPAAEPPKDPLAEIWRLALWQPRGTEKPTWGVGYGPQRLQGEAKTSVLAWHLWVADPGKAPREYLKDWFLKMAEAIGETEKEEATLDRAAANWEPKNKAESEQMVAENARARAPQNAAEEAELKALAARGPGPVYAWVFGEGGYYAARSKGLSWKDLGMADAEEGYRKVVETVRAAQQFDPAKFNAEMMKAIRKIASGGSEKQS